MARISVESSTCPSSSRLRSVLRQEEPLLKRPHVLVSQQFPTSIGAQTPPGWSRPRRWRRCPSSSRLRSVLRQSCRLACRHMTIVPAVPDFDRCSDIDQPLKRNSTGRSQQFPTSIGAQTMVSLLLRDSGSSPSSSRLRSVLRPDAWRFARAACPYVPAVPDFDRCSDRSVSVVKTTVATVPAVPDFDRCSDD